MGRRDITVATIYDNEQFTGFHTTAYETTTNFFGEKSIEYLYRHSILDEPHARIQHGLAIAFVREKHIASLVAEYYANKRTVQNPEVLSPVSTPSDQIIYVDEEELELYDINEEEEKER